MGAMLLQMHGNQFAEPFRPDNRPRLRGRDLLPAALMLILLVGGLLAASLGLGGGAGQGEGYLVIAPPGWTLARTTGLVRAAGGRLVRPGGFSNTVIAASADPHFGQALENAGALFVRRVSGPLGCASPQETAPRPQTSQKP
ncbi:hypothetical protein WBP06_22585 [Novosphingobium sp. BL-8H]|uniref:hypothetical protein n=1 Tax=Novosphingobium sp. BL-8H TaxID=3127640 RepID=UPI003758039D